MYKLFHLSLCAFGLFLPTTMMVGQVATETDNYGMFDNFGQDTVNVGNLNVHFNIPILHEAGCDGRSRPQLQSAAADSLPVQADTFCLVSYALLVQCLFSTGTSQAGLSTYSNQKKMRDLIPVYSVESKKWIAQWAEVLAGAT